MTADGVTGEDQLDDVEGVERGVPAPAAVAEATPTGATEADATLANAMVPDTTSGRARWGVFVGVAGTVIVFDQLTKAWLVANVAVGEVMSIVGDLVRFVQSQNTGALFGLFRDQAILFALVSIGVIGLIVLYHGRAGRSLYLSIALGLLLGGAIGNMIDRLRLGYVVDWVDIGLGSLRFWTFNVADSAISLAIVMLVGLALFPALAGGARERGAGDA
jgi:signal peptidase II